MVHPEVAIHPHNGHSDGCPSKVSQLNFGEWMLFFGFLAWLKSQQPATVTVSAEEVRRIRESIGRT